MLSDSLNFTYSRLGSRNLGIQSSGSRINFTETSAECLAVVILTKTKKKTNKKNQKTSTSICNY